MARHTMSKFCRQGFAKRKSGAVIIHSSSTPMGCSMAPDYISTPFPKKIFEDGYILKNGVYQRSLKDAVLDIYNLQSLKNDVFIWSFASTDQLFILAALRIGETFHLKLRYPFKKVSHISKTYSNWGMPIPDYGQYPFHVTVDNITGKSFDVITSWKAKKPRSQSRLPFIMCFQVFGFRKSNKHPLWRRFLSDATIFAQKSEWGIALLHIAFALESFIDSQFSQKLKKIDLGTGFNRYLANTRGKKEKTHLLLHQSFAFSKIEELFKNKLLGEVFSIRNDIAHGKITHDSITSMQYINALKTAVEFIWDSDKKSRHLLIPIWHHMDGNQLIDDKLFNDCQNEKL